MKKRALFKFGSCVFLAVVLAAITVAALEAPFFGHVHNLRFLKKADTGADEQTVSSPTIVSEYLQDAPWHLIDFYMFYPEPIEATSVSCDFVIFDEPAYPPNIFVVPIDAICNERQFYVGLADDIGGGQSRDGGEPQRVKSSGVMFSRWGDKDPNAVRVSDYGYFLALDHDGDIIGDFVSARTPYRFEKGRFTVKLERNSRRESIADHIWVDASIYSHQSKLTTFVGALRFPGTTLKFSKFGAFVEFFQTEARTRPKRFPALTLAFGSIRVDGQLVLPAKTGAVFHAHVPDFARLLRREGDSQHAKEFRKIFADDERALLVFIRDQEKVFREKDEEYRVFP